MLSVTKSRYAGKKLFLVLFALLFTASLLNAQDTAELKKKMQMMCDKFAQAMVSGEMGNMWIIIQRTLSQCQVMNQC